MIVGSVLMTNNPRNVQTWVAIILILGLFSLFGVITAPGGMLSIAGGVITMAWKPSIQNQTPLNPQN
jgi:hypothetical protein